MLIILRITFPIKVAKLTYDENKQYLFQHSHKRIYFFFIFMLPRTGVEIKKRPNWPQKKTAIPVVITASLCH